MKIYIGVTDDNWYNFLARNQPDEVNRLIILLNKSKGVTEKILNIFTTWNRLS
jgi:hypothetical protein